jgi:2-hydroxychromene-2-carboxylate isomerase
VNRGDANAVAHDPAIKDELRRTTLRAHELGVFGVPTIGIAEELFWGDERVEDAAEYLRSVAVNLR